MAGVPDPYGVLGLPRGASLDEVKRAYRRLAKQHHPDSGGERALPRFLEIQAAYEVLVGGSAASGWRRRGAGPSGTAGPPGASGASGGAAGGPWQADDARAEATRRAYGSRARRTTGRPGTTGGAGTTGGSGTTGGAGATGGAARGTTDATGPGRPSRRGRPPNRATPGSTTYDGIEDEPFEPGWTGASWYGTTSGTYWTLNPREYADPRKHGPEYQARARRRREAAEASSFAEAPDSTDPADSAERAERGDPADPAQAPRSAIPDPEPAGDDPGAPDAHATAETAPGVSWSAEAVPDPAATEAGPSSGAGEATGAPRDARGASWRRTSGWAGERRPDPRAGDATPFDPFDPGPTLSEVGRRLTRDPSRPWTRLGLAIAGGAPLVIGLAWLLGEVTGCGRFAAACDSGIVSLAWLAGVAVVALLALIPAVATVLTAGTVTLLAAGIPATVLLTATGGARLPEASTAVLGFILVLGWLTGVGWAVGRRRRHSAGSGPVS